MSKPSSTLRNILTKLGFETGTPVKMVTRRDNIFVNPEITCSIQSLSTIDLSNYTHQGRQFRVMELDLETKTAVLSANMEV